MSAPSHPGCIVPREGLLLVAKVTSHFLLTRVVGGALTTACLRLSVYGHTIPTTHSVRSTVHIFGAFILPRPHLVARHIIKHLLSRMVLAKNRERVDGST